MTDESPEDLNEFLSKIDDIHRLVENLSSDDVENVSKALKESDELLKKSDSKIGVNRTSINKSDTSANSFLSALEKDADERAERNRKNKIVADELKSKGNDAFHREFYDEAIRFYTEALKIKKDYDVLYTNRAQVFVKLGRYDDALNDCEWALKCSPTMIKAFVIRGKCWLKLKDFDRADEEFRQAEQIATFTTRQMIKDCFKDVENQREIFRRENSARKFLDNENSTETPMTLTKTLTKLEKSTEPLIYYVGGIDFLCQLINDETTRTAFRLQNGFHLFNTNSMLKDATDERLTSSIFDLLTILIENDDENLRQTFEMFFIKKIFSTENFFNDALKFFVEVSLKNLGRTLILTQLRLDTFFSQIFRRKSTRTFSLKLIGNLSIESRVKTFFSDEIRLAKLFEIFLDESTRRSIFSLLTNLFVEKSFRKFFLDQNNFVKILIDEFESIQDDDDEQFANLLGLFVNLTSSEVKIEIRLVETICRQLKTSKHQQRLLTLLSNVVQNDSSFIDILIEKNVVRTISEIVKIKNDEIFRSAARFFAIFTQTNSRAQQMVANEDQRESFDRSHHLLSRITDSISDDFYEVHVKGESSIDENLIESTGPDLISCQKPAETVDSTRFHRWRIRLSPLGSLLLSFFEHITTNENSLMIGNAVLTFSNVVQHSSTRSTLEKCFGIRKTLEQLLKLVEKTSLNVAARKNLAIFITKLVKSDEKFLEEFRRQHGTEILHSAMKNIEL